MALTPDRILLLKSAADALAGHRLQLFLQLGAQGVQIDLGQPLGRAGGVQGDAAGLPEGAVDVDLPVDGDGRHQDRHGRGRLHPHHQVGHLLDVSAAPAHRGAVAGQPDGDGAANAGQAAGDDCNSVRVGHWATCSDWS